jgi:hypothetical protein
MSDNEPVFTLLHRLEMRYAELYAKWRSYSKEKLIKKAHVIAVTTAIVNSLGDIELSDDVVDILLSLRDPLGILVRFWPDQYVGCGDVEYALEETISRVWECCNSEDYIQYLDEASNNESEIPDAEDDDLCKSQRFDLPPSYFDRVIFTDMPIYDD